MVEEGQKVIIKGVFEGFPDPNVLWLHNQTPVRPSHDVKIEVRNKETSISFTKVSHLICFYLNNFKVDFRLYLNPYDLM